MSDPEDQWGDPLVSIIPPRPLSFAGLFLLLRHLLVFFDRLLSLSLSLSLLLDIGIHSCFFLIILCGSLARHLDRLLLKCLDFYLFPFGFDFARFGRLWLSRRSVLYLPLPAASFFFPFLL